MSLCISAKSLYIIFFSPLKDATAYGIISTREGRWGRGKGKGRTWYRILYNRISGGIIGFGIKRKKPFSLASVIIGGSLTTYSR